MDKRQFCMGKALTSNRFIKGEIAAEFLVTRKKSASGYC